MRGLFADFTAASATSAAAYLAGYWLWIALPALAVIVLTWRFRCLHRGPLALLPAVTDMNGERLPARWCCDRCGKTWPGHFDHETKPVQKFAGFDEHKAVAAAERAHVLEEQRRQNAMQRAGLNRPRIAKRRRVPVVPPESNRPNVVPINEVRRQA